MKNYINARIQTSKHSKTINDIKHNLRLVESLNQKNENINVHFSPEGNQLNYSDMKLILKDYKKDRKIHSKQFQEQSKTNLNIRDRNSTWLNGLFTFSEAVEVELGTKEEIENQVVKTYTYIDTKTKEKITIKGIPKYTIEELRKISLSAANDLAEHLGVSLKYISEHNDEERIHYQYHFENFKIGEQNTVFFENRTADKLSLIQDLAFKHFEELGMDRGIKKEISNSNYQRTQSYYENTIRELRVDNENLKKSNIDLIEEYNKNIKLNENIIKENIIQRKEVKDLDLSRTEKQEERKRLTAINKELNNVNKVIEQLKVTTLKDIEIKNKELDNKAKEFLELAELTKNQVKEVIEDKEIYVIELEETIENLESQVDYLSNEAIREVELKNENNKLLENNLKLEKSIESKEEIENNIEKSIVKLKENREKVSKKDMEQTIKNSINKIINDKDNYKLAGKILDKDKLRPVIIKEVRKLVKIDIYDNDIKKIEEKLKKEYNNELLVKDRVIEDKDNLIKSYKLKIGNSDNKVNSLKDNIKELENNVDTKITSAIVTQKSNHKEEINKINENHTNKINNLITENKITTLKLDNKVFDLESKVKGLEKKIKKIKNSFKNFAKSVSSKYNYYKNKIIEDKEKINNMDTKIEKLEEDRDNLEYKIDTINEIDPTMEDKLEQHDKEFFERVNLLPFTQQHEEEFKVHKVSDTDTEEEDNNKSKNKSYGSGHTQ